MNIEITGCVAAARETQNLKGAPRAWYCEVWLNKSTGEVWAKMITDNNWTVYNDPDIVLLLNATCPRTAKEIRMLAIDEVER